MNRGIAGAKNILRYLLPVMLLAVWAGFNNCGRLGGGSQSVNTASETVLGNPFSPDGIAALPQVYLNSNYPKIPTGSVTWTVGKGKQFSNCQPAIDAANPGDIISIDAGFVCSPIILRNKNYSGTNYIVIQSANLNLLPPQGTRVGPGDFANLAIIETTSGSAVTAEPMASYYQLVGLEIRVNAQDSIPNMPLVELGTNGVTTLTVVPSNIVLARDYIHGTPNQDIGFGIEFNGAAISVVDSMITEIHSLTTVAGGGRAISAATLGAGPFKVDNNEIESGAAGFALATWTPIAGLIPSDVEFQHNFVHKNPIWKTQMVTTTAGATGLWITESHVWLVNAQRILINGNTFEDAYFLTGNSGGYALALEPSSSGFGQQSVGHYYWVRVQDITFTNNIINTGAGVFDINYDDPQFPSVATLRIDIENNLAYGIGSTPVGQSSGMIRLQNAAQGPVEFNHNTLLDVANGGPPMIYATTGGSFSQLTLINNIFNDEGKGIYDPALGTGSATLNGDFPGVVLQGNVLAGQLAANYGTYVSGNYFPASMSAVGFLVDPTGGVGNYMNLSLSPQSPYVGLAVDGTNPGVSISQLLQ